MDREKIIVRNERANGTDCNTRQLTCRMRRHPAQSELGQLLLLNIPKPNENLARPTAKFHSDFFEVLFRAFLHLGNIGERILVLQFFNQHVINILQVSIAGGEDDTSAIARDEIEKLVLGINVSQKVLADVLQLDPVVLWPSL